MKNIIFLLSLSLIVSCTKKAATTKEEELIPTPTEKKIIDAAEKFFKNSSGEYYEIVNNYWVALRPMLTVRKALTEGACTSNVFTTQQCCCPWEFLLSPYDAVNGTTTTFNYPKSALFISKPGKMTGTISAAFASRPVSSDRTEVQYNNLTWAGTSVNLNGTVVIKDVVIPVPYANMLYTAELSNNSFTISTGQITSISGQLSFTQGDASGNLDITFADGRRITTEITVSDMPLGVYAAFIKRASFTTEGVTSLVECHDKHCITIGTRTFNLNID